MTKDHSFRNGCLFYLILYIILPFGLAIFGSIFGGKKTKDPVRHAPTYYSSPAERNINTDGEGEVYICTGGSSRRYHRTPYCCGLNNCRDEIIDVTIEEAEDEGKTPCQRCY